MKHPSGANYSGANPSGASPSGASHGGQSPSSFKLFCSSQKISILTEKLDLTNTKLK